MKLSMWIVYDWLKDYEPKKRIKSGELCINGVRYLSDDLEMQQDYLYIGYLDPKKTSPNDLIICVNSTDIITLSAPDIYTVFNEMQQMIEYYNNWETQVLQMIYQEREMKDILALTVPVLKTSVALTDISHKVIAEAHLPGSWNELELQNGYLTPEDLQVINTHLRQNARNHRPYMIQTAKTIDMIRNFYSRDDRLIGWFVSLNGGEKDSLHARQQLVETFCLFLDLWFRIHVGETYHQSSLFSDVLESRETEPENIALRLEGLGWTGQPQMRLIILESCYGEDLGIIGTIRSLTYSYPFVADCVYHDKYVLVVNCRETEPDAFFRTLKKLMETQKLYCAVSYVFSDLLSLGQHFQQALCALEFGDRTEGSVNYYGDHALDYMRSRFRSVTEPEMTSPVLSDLKRHDLENGTDYYHTLRIYLLCERNQTLAADLLCIHRNSLVYRVNRLKEMIDADLDDADTRLHLLLSYFLEE